MARFTSPLEGVRVAAPCPADWERMAGDGRVRFCSQCNLNVYNLSGMTRAEAEALLTKAEGRLCVRFYRRSDGTILTNQCPVGLRALKARAGRVASAVFSAVVGFFGGLGFHGLAGGGTTPRPNPYPVTGALRVSEVGETVGKPPVPPRPDHVEPLMGAIARPPKKSPESGVRSRNRNAFDSRLRTLDS